MRRRQIKFEHDEDDDPMSVVSNLFDAAMVFAVALMVALVTHYKMTEMFSTEGELYRGKESGKAEYGDYFEERKADRTLHSIEKSGR